MLDPSPCFLLGTGKAVKRRAGTQRRSRSPCCVPLPPRPKIEVEDYIYAKLKASRPMLADQLRYASKKDRKLVNRRIIAIQTRHPLVLTEANCWQVPLKLAGEGGLACTEEPVDQMGGCHIDLLQS